ARTPTPAPAAPGSPSPAHAPAAAWKTSSMSAAGASAAAGGDVPGRAAARVRGDLRGPHAQVRAQLAAQRRRRRDPRPARRRALPAPPRRRAADQLRQALVTGKVLPPRDEELARTGQWLTGILTAAKPATARRLVQAYATWHVMRRPRASAARADGHAPTPPT